MQAIEPILDDRSLYAKRAEELFARHRTAIFEQTDRLFCVLLLLQYLMGIVAALWVAPLTWEGDRSAVHLHVWAALFLGAAVVAPPALLAFFRPGRVETRHSVAVGQMLMGALLIHLFGGRIETHFHVFGSLAFLAMYRDWRVILSATTVVAADHFLRGMFWPRSVFGELVVSEWRWLEHVGWVVVEDFFLILACGRSLREMRAIAERQAKQAQTNQCLQETVRVLQQEMAARERAETRIQEEQVEWDRKIQERTAELTASAERLKEEMRNRHQLETQLCQTQKMDAIGHLAGGIAHDFNNLLTIINGHSESLFRSLGSNYRACQRVQEIARAGEKATQLTRQLLAFSRQQIMRARVLNLNDLVGDFQRVLGRLLGEAITLTTRLHPGLGQVKVDPGQIEQVLVNLAANARDAMPHGGLMSIETRNADMDEAYARARPDVKPGRYAMLAVSDTGCGMGKETLSHVFEPFFTTKEVGKGTGLGLATAYGIVKQSGGFIYVYSEVGRGSTFKVYLPLVEEESTPVPEQPAAAPGVGNETILLAEDEPGVRDLLRSLLEESGYEVLAAANGAEALELARNRARPIHLLLTDVVMPVMGGRVLAEHFTAAFPDAGVLFMSGYTDDMIVRSGVLEAEMEFIQKPYTMHQLLSKIREVLDRGGAGAADQRCESQLA